MAPRRAPAGAATKTDGAINAGNRACGFALEVLRSLDAGSIAFDAPGFALER